MSNSALQGVRVVEYAPMVGGPYCGKLLADLGADVIKVEAPAGDPARRYGLFANTDANQEGSPLFLYTNAGKRGITLDLDIAADVDEFKRMLRWADVFIDGSPPRYMESLGLGWDTIRTLNARLVYTCVTPYGRTGPRADVAADELTLIHAAGLGNLLPTRSVDTSRAPVKTGGHPIGFHGGVAACVATLAALLQREKTGAGCLVDVSLQEAMLAMLSPQVASTRYHKSTWNRVPDRPPAMGRMQTSDGYVILNALDDHHFTAFSELMGNPSWCAGEEWASMAYRVHHLMEIAPRIDEWMLGQEKDAVHHAAAKRRIPIGPMNTAAEVMASPQYEARGYFTEVEHPIAGKHRYAGVPYRMSASPARVQRPAPLLGEHNEEVIGKLEANSRGNRRDSAEEGAKKRLPLEGVRVVEFAWVWAGPYAGMLLAQLGAEVIKVESHNRTDLMRRTVVWPLEEHAPAQVSQNQGISFNAVNMNKKSATIDMSTPAGAELARKLAATADIVFDNMRPGALGKLGLGYEDLRALREDIIVASSSGRGTLGPESQYLGYAMIHHAIGGASYITGYPDDHPCHSTGEVDIMNATTLALAILAALHHHSRTGEGQFIDYSQCEGVSSLIGDVLLGYAMTSEIPERAGNADPMYAPHNVYRAWGVDRWIAIEVHSDEEFRVFCALIGEQNLGTDPRFATAKLRKQNERELDAVIEEWTNRRDRDWMVNEFEAAGLMAAPSRESRDLYADPHLRARGAFVTVNHPELGELELVAPPWKMDTAPVEAKPAPLLGEHNAYVFEEVLGLSADEIAALREKGVIL